MRQTISADCAGPKKKEDSMGYTFFAISAYIFMRAFEVIFKGQEKKSWYNICVRIIGVGVLYSGLATMIWLYFNGIHLLGFDPK